MRDNGFSESIPALVEGHVKAKRYRAPRDEGYYDGFSSAERKLLENQGGKMSEAEANTFEQSNYFGLSLNLGYWAETAVKSNQKIPNLAFIKEMIIRHLQKNRVGV